MGGNKDPATINQRKPLTPSTLVFLEWCGRQAVVYRHELGQDDRNRLRGLIDRGYMREHPNSLQQGFKVSAEGWAALKGNR